MVFLIPLGGRAELLLKWPDSWEIATLFLVPLRERINDALRDARLAKLISQERKAIYFAVSIREREG